MIVNNTTVEKVKAAMLAMQRLSWEQGEGLQTLLELGDGENLVRLSKAAIIRQDPVGPVAVISPTDMRTPTDPCSCGEPLLRAYEITKDEYFKDAVDQLIDWAVNRAPRDRNGIIYHLYVPTEGHPWRQFWLDSFYMLPPFLAAAGYPEEAVKQIDGWWDILYQPDKKVLYHTWDEGAGGYFILSTVNGKEALVPREQLKGKYNGFVLAGIARVIQLLPERMSQEKQRLINKVKTLIDGLLGFMLDDGRFYNELDNPNTIKEACTSMMLCYTLYRGMSGGWLDKSHEGLAEKLRKLSLSLVDCYGFIGGVCANPSRNNLGVNFDAQAFWLLVECAYADYAEREKGEGK